MSSVLPNFSPQRHLKLNDVVYDGLFELIVAGELPVGGKLPPESRLATQFGVSRPTVREALERLRDDGLVASRRGSGSFVTHRPSGAVLRLARLSSIADMQRCFEFRIALEGEAAFYAAARRSTTMLQALRSTLERLERETGAEMPGVDADIEFHLALCRASDNRFFTDAVASLRENIEIGINLARNLTLMRPRSRSEVVQAEHRQIYDAVAAGDGEAARRAARRHLEQAKRRVFDGEDAPDKM